LVISISIPGMGSKSKKRIEVNPAQKPIADFGRAFDQVQLPELPEGEMKAPPSSPERPAPLWKPGRVVLRRETAHRGGKVVTVVDDFATHLPASFIDDVARRIRQACGCGGTVKMRQIEIQGDQVTKIRAFLESEGFQVAGVR
jgi:translation initiation factor 1